MEIQEARSRTAMPSSWCGYSCLAASSAHAESNVSLCVLRPTLRRTWTWPADQVRLDIHTL